MADSLSALYLQNPQLAIALRRRAEAEAMMKEGGSGEPIKSPWQGVNNLAKALLGGWDARKADEEMKGIYEADNEEVSGYGKAIGEGLLRMNQGGGQAPQAPPSAAPMSGSAPMGGAAASAPSRGSLPIAAEHLPIEGKGFLTAVSGAESPDYNTIYGGKKFLSYNAHPGQAVPIQSGPYAGQTSSAAGRYQFLGPTWEGVAKKFGLSDFSPETQDIGAWSHAQDVYKAKTGRDLLPDLQTPMRRKSVESALAGVWPSMPGGDQRNGATDGFWSRYDGVVGGAQAAQGAPQQRQQFASANTGTATDAGGGMGEPTPQPMGAQPQPQQMAQAQPGGVGMPTRQPPPNGGALMDIYLRGAQHRNPRIRAQAEALKPFIKQETPPPINNEVPLGNGMMQKVTSYDGGRTFQPVGVAYDPRGPDRDLVPIVQEDGTTRYMPRPNAANAISARPMPAGYQRGPNGLAPIPGGPEDPTRPMPPPAGYQSQGAGLAPVPGGPADPNREQPPPAGYQAAGQGRRMEAVPGGPEDPSKQQFPRANVLRDEFTTLTKDFRVVQDAHQKFQAAAKSGTNTGDMAMLYTYVRMLDPGSVVRESEFAMAAAQGTFGQRVQGAAQRVLTGEGMAPALRQEFAREADQIFKQQRRTYDHTASRFGALAESFGLDPKQIAIDYVTPPEAAAPAAQPGEPARRDPNNPLGLKLPGAK